VAQIRLVQGSGSRGDLNFINKTWSKDLSNWCTCRVSSSFCIFGGLMNVGPLPSNVRITRGWI
jgi:hypothetical protein